MTNKQFDEVERTAKAYGIDFSRCPTCEAKRREVAPGIYEWPEDSAYTYQGYIVICNCQQQDMLRRHYLLAHIPQRYWRYSYADYYGDPKSMEEAQAYVTQWQGYKRQGIGIEFFSPGQGSGKTFLATWIARELVKCNEDVYYTRFLSLMGLFNKPYEERREIEDRLAYSTVLVLDEVGQGQTDAQNAYFAVEFEDLMRTRVDNARPTIMTTNMRPEQLDKSYSRIYSVLAGAQKRHEVKFEDVRRKGDVLLLDTHLVKTGEVRPIC